MLAAGKMVKFDLQNHKKYKIKNKYNDELENIKYIHNWTHL